MTYEQWLEESQINEIPEQYRDEFKQATKAAWSAGQQNLMDEALDGSPAPKNEIVLWRNLERVFPNLFVPRNMIEKFIIELDKIKMLNAELTRAHTEL